MRVEVEDRLGYTGTIYDDFTHDYEGPMEYKINELIGVHEESMGYAPAPGRFELDDEDLTVTGEVWGPHTTEHNLQMLAASLGSNPSIVSAEFIE